MLDPLIDLLPGLAVALCQTLTMLGMGVSAAALFGGPLGILLFLVGDGQSLQNRPLALPLGWTVNTIRSFPFIILLVALVPLTRLIAGTSIGPLAASVPLSIAETDIMVFTVAVVVALVQVIQLTGTRLARRLGKR